MAARTGRIATVILVTLAPLLTGCGKDSTGPTNDWVGAWSGTTSQGRNISFLVEGDGIVLLVAGYAINGSSCLRDVESFFPREPPDQPYDVAAGTFSVARTGSDISTSVAGTFSSTTQASGTLQATTTTCAGSINETWTATKNNTATIDLDGAWEGNLRSSLVTDDTVSLVLSQSGATVTGTYTTGAGGEGTVTGTVRDRHVTFRLNQTTPGCTGRFDGHAAMLDLATFDILIFFYTGNDCLGAHTRGSGFTER